MWKFEKFSTGSVEEIFATTFPQPKFPHSTALVDNFLRVFMDCRTNAFPTGEGMVRSLTNSY